MNNGDAKGDMVSSGVGINVDVPKIDFVSLVASVIHEQILKTNALLAEQKYLP